MNTTHVSGGNAVEDDVGTALVERIRIFDTTLRDGEQSPGCSLRPRQKLTLAHALAELGADVIEAGFAASSDADAEGIRAIAREVRAASICSLARCHAGDIEAAVRALEPAARPRLHVFISTSPLHREHKLGLDRAQVLARAVEGVSLARKHIADVEFSAEDALRTEPEFLVEIFDAAIAAGASTINVPDTVGYTTPAEIRALFEYLRKHVRGAEGVVFSSHCHNDLGLAVANSLAAIEGGARQVECTINGIGERAGNCALEELVMALKVRRTWFNADTGIDTTRLVPTSRLLARSTGMAVQRNKAIVGANAFAHEAGIHQHGMLKHRGTYEIMHPESVGWVRSHMVLGRHSGRHAINDRLRELGFTLDDVGIERVFAAFKALAEKKREVFDADIEAIALNSEPGQSRGWQLVRWTVHTGTAQGSMPTADWVRLLRAGLASLLERRIGADPDRRLAWMLVAGSIPGAVIGALAESEIEALFHEPGAAIAGPAMIVLAVLLALMGAALLVAERIGRKVRNLSQLGFRDALLIGLAQALAVFPGVSRSGATMTAGLGLGLTRETAARFSFLLSAPIIAGAGAKSVYDIVQGLQSGAIAGSDFVLFPVGFFAAAVSGFLCIKFLLAYLQQHSMRVFVFYRWALAALIILVVVLRR